MSNFELASAAKAGRTNLSRPVRLRVKAADEATELYVIDARFELACPRQWRVDRGLPPGAYKIKQEPGRRFPSSWCFLRPVARVSCTKCRA